MTAESSRPHIAFIHPRDISRDMYVAALAAEGFSTTEFDSPEDAAPWLETGTAPSLLITELLPRPESAWALVERQCRGTTATPVMILTSLLRPDRKYRRRATAYGVAAFVAKPCSLRQLVEIVVRVLGGERNIESIAYVEGL